jgi:hypothetical protein
MAVYHRLAYTLAFNGRVSKVWCTSLAGAAIVWPKLHLSNSPAVSHVAKSLDVSKSV